MNTIVSQFFQPSPHQNVESNASAAHGMEGEPLTVEQAIANLRQRQDLGLCYYAAWWLGKFRVCEPSAIDALLEALQDELDRSPDGGYPLRRNAARALGKVGAHGGDGVGDRPIVPRLVECLGDSDYYVREAAVQALELIGDPACIPALMKLLDGGVAVATQVPGKPHLREPYDSVIEALGTLQATEGVEAIHPFLNHSMARVQLSAARALWQLTGDSQYGDRLVQALQAPELQLRRSALIDLGAIGYVPAAGAIAQTLAENSLKLIALKGLLVQSLEDVSPQMPERISTQPSMQSTQSMQPSESLLLPSVLSEVTMSILDLMDGLL